MRRVALLDVNVLVALFSSQHVHHEVAHEWFARERQSGWATCAISESGVVRILSNPAVSDPPSTPLDAIARLRQFCASGDHTHWANDISLREVALNAEQPFGYSRLTDIYLLALAIHHNGRLVTFDRSIPSKAIKDAPPDCLEVIFG